MKSGSIGSLGLVLLTTIALTGPGASAHNTFKYNNVPFAMPGFCINDHPSPPVSAQYVTVAGMCHVPMLFLQVVASGIIAFPSNTFGTSGFSVFVSNPTSNPDTSLVPSGTFPKGTITFSISPASTAQVNYVLVDNLGNISALGLGSVVNGTATINTNVPPLVGPTLSKVAVYIGNNTLPFNLGTGPTSTYLVNNLTLNGQTLNGDSTSSDTNTVPVGYCGL